MNLLRRTLWVVTAACAALFVHAATEDPAQRQLREDRERFQREIDRQATETRIRDDQARLAADQKRTADELERLRAQQSRQTSEIRSLTETTRILTTAPVIAYPPRVIATSSATVLTSATAATVTPDFSVVRLPDGNCVLYLKGRPAEVKSPAQVQAALEQFLSTEKAPLPTP